MGNNAFSDGPHGRLADRPLEQRDDGLVPQRRRPCRSGSRATRRSTPSRTRRRCSAAEAGSRGARPHGSSDRGTFAPVSRDRTPIGFRRYLKWRLDRLALRRRQPMGSMRTRILQRLRLRLARQEGFALVAALGMSVVMGAVGTSVMLYSTSGAGHSARMKADQQAFALAEAALNNAYAVVYNASNPTMSNAVPRDHPDARGRHRHLDGHARSAGERLDAHGHGDHAQPDARRPDLAHREGEGRARHLDARRLEQRRLELPLLRRHDRLHERRQLREHQRSPVRQGQPRACPTRRASRATSSRSAGRSRSRTARRSGRRRTRRCTTSTSAARARAAAAASSASSRGTRIPTA